MKKLFNSLIALILFVSVGQAAAQNNDHKPNHVGIYPITVTNDGVGLGVFFERDIGTSRNATFILPVKFVIQSYDEWYYGHQMPGYDITRYKNFVEFAPGFKFYPGNRERVAVFAVGPSLYYSYGTYDFFKDVMNDPVAPLEREYFNRKSHSLGILGNGYLDITISKQFVMGVQLGLGVNYIKRDIDTYSDGTKKSIQSIFQPAGQFSLTFGYKF